MRNPGIKTPVMVMFLERYIRREKTNAAKMDF